MTSRLASIMEETSRLLRLCLPLGGGAGEGRGEQSGAAGDEDNGRSGNCIDDDVARILDDVIEILDNTSIVSQRDKQEAIQDQEKEYKKQ